MEDQPMIVFQYASQMGRGLTMEERELIAERLAGAPITPAAVRLELGVKTED